MQKFIGAVPITKVDSQRRIISGYASVEVVDRQGEIISRRALEKAIDEYMRNPIVRWMHEPVPIGKVLSAVVDEKGLHVEAYITDKTEKAREVWGLIEDGIIKAFSIGGKLISKDTAKADDGRLVNVITGMELREISVVDLPANPESFFEVIAKMCDAECDSMSDVEKGVKVSNGAWNPPSTQEDRQKLKDKCGAKAFLMPDELKFPVMNSDCSYNLNGIRAAITRAAQNGYSEVEAKARRLLERLSSKKGDNMETNEIKKDEPQPSQEEQVSAEQHSSEPVAEQPEAEKPKAEEQKGEEREAKEAEKSDSVELEKIYKSILAKVEEIEKKLDERKGLVEQAVEKAADSEQIDKHERLGRALVKLVKG